MRGELFGEAAHRALGLGGDEKTARVLVEAMHNAGRATPPIRQASLRNAPAAR
jgi:hypothetical protein